MVLKHLNENSYRKTNKNKFNKKIMKFSFSLVRVYLLYRVCLSFGKGRLLFDNKNTYFML